MLRPETGKRRRFRQRFASRRWRYRRRASIGQDVIVVGHGVHVVEGNASVIAGVPRGGYRGRRVMLGAQMAEDLFRDRAVINQGHDAHGVLAERAAQRVHMPDAQDQVPPPF